MKITLEDNQVIEVNLMIKHLSFSAHADAKGIMQLIEQSGAKNVVLVHGEAGKMNVLKSLIESKNIPCYSPANLETIVVQKTPIIKLSLDTSLLRNHSTEIEFNDELDVENIKPRNKVVRGLVSTDAENPNQLVVKPIDGLSRQEVWFKTSTRVKSESVNNFLSNLYQHLKG